MCRNCHGKSVYRIVSPQKYQEITSTAEYKSAGKEARRELVDAGAEIVLCDSLQRKIWIQEAKMRKDKATVSLNAQDVEPS